MTDTRISLIEASRVLLEVAAGEESREDITGHEMQAVYGVIKHVTTILHSYTITETAPELRGGAQSAASEMQRALWFLEDAWLLRYSAQPLGNIVPIPLRRAS